MASRPQISPGNWIVVGKQSCVVANVREPGNHFGDCEVVFNPLKPTNADVVWSDEGWKFVETGDYGGYAEKYARLSLYVGILKNGRKA